MSNPEVIATAHEPVDALFFRLFQGAIRRRQGYMERALTPPQQTFSFEFVAEGPASAPETSDYWAESAANIVERRLGVGLEESGVILMQTSPTEFEALAATSADASKLRSK